MIAKHGNESLVSLKKKFESGDYYFILKSQETGQLIAVSLSD